MYPLSRGAPETSLEVGLFDAPGVGKAGKLIEHRTKTRLMRAADAEQLAAKASGSGDGTALQKAQRAGTAGVTGAKPSRAPGDAGSASFAEGAGLATLGR